MTRPTTNNITISPFLFTRRCRHILIGTFIAVITLLINSSSSKNSNILVVAGATNPLVDCVPGKHEVTVDESSIEQAPDKFYVKFITSASGADDDAIVLEIIREWSPTGVDRFFHLMKDNYYNCGAFFRVVPDFVIQFGIASEPDETKKWDIEIKDDPVIQSNVYGTITYATAGPNTRTTQLFINLKDNVGLDNQGFTPFGKVIDGMDTLTKIKNPTPHSSGGADQQLYKDLGNEWILQEYNNNIDIITNTEIQLL